MLWVLFSTINYYLYLVRYLFPCCLSSCFRLGSFSFCLKNTLYFYSRFAMTKSPSLMSLLLTKNVVTAYRTWGWQLFSFSTSRMMVFYFLMNSFTAVVKASVWLLLPWRPCLPVPRSLMVFIAFWAILLWWI